MPAMLAAVGLITQEFWHPLFGGAFFGAPIYHFQEVQNIPFFLASFLASISIIEGLAINKYWSSSQLDSEGFIEDDQIPGDLGFDPMGFNPDSKTGFKSTYNRMSPGFRRRRTQELNNGRLGELLPFSPLPLFYPSLALAHPLTSLPPPSSQPLTPSFGPAAMIGALGIIAQEYVTHKGVFPGTV